MNPKKYIQNLLVNVEKTLGDKSILMQFIPIVLVLIYMSYKEWFIEVSHTRLGKLVAILLIIYYTSIDYVFGTLCCVIVIAFYQMNEREGLDEKTIPVESTPVASTPVAPVTPVAPKSGASPQVTSVTPVAPTPVAPKPGASPQVTSVTPVTYVVPKSVPPKPMTSVSPIPTSIINKKNKGGYKIETTTYIKPNTIDAFTTARDTFIREKCQNGILMYKDFPVKTEMADHIYPEIKYNTKSRCNPCDNTCDYSIIEAKLNNETELYPRSSNSLFDLVKDMFYPKRGEWKEPEAMHNPIRA
jgi:hypothetical protein